MTVPSFDHVRLRPWVLICLLVILVTGAACGSSLSPRSAGSAAEEPRCVSGQLSVLRLPHFAAGAGHQTITVGFKNVSGSTCTLSGYPQVVALNAHGAPVELAHHELRGMMGGLVNGTKVPPIVTLHPGDTASAMIEGIDVPTGTATTCPYYPEFHITAPYSTKATMLTIGSGYQGFPGCSPISVDPIEPGVTGEVGLSSS